jgi:hypothetical protein
MHIIVRLASLHINNIVPREFLVKDMNSPIDYPNPPPAPSSKTPHKDVKYVHMPMSDLQKAKVAVSVSVVKSCHAESSRRKKPPVMLGSREKKRGKQ